MGYPPNYPHPHRGNPLRGRIKYRLRDDQGEFTTRFTSKAEVLRYVGEMIPKLKSRIEINRIMDEHKKVQNMFFLLFSAVLRRYLKPYY